ncbi:hypothetical protein L1987_07576 [Smallanthus sonchifolius]|uniref:Uncharacterized protein n=1 Tax=Smallanthus sonchifolius TaxID=185202 RepID=A0ACB9K0U6_9ASTR|nr:hypothetical protein L1987_07576 [Smallanthus sonchifolius]
MQLTDHCFNMHELMVKSRVLQPHADLIVIIKPSHKKRRRVSPNADGAGPSFVSVDDTGAQTLAQSTLRASLLQSVARERARAACSLSTSVSASMDPDQLMSATMDLSSPVYMDLGDCTNSCKFCGALFWFAERLLSFPLHYLLNPLARLQQIFIL